MSICSKGWTKEARENFLDMFVKAFMPNPSLFPMDWLKQTDFFTAPASTCFHGSYEGGLFDHCINVADVLFKLSKGVVLPSTKPWERPESPIIVGLLHDATKLGLYVKNEQGVWTHDPNYVQLGSCHGDDSRVKVNNYVDLTEEEQLCIRWHMGAYEGPESWDGYDAAIKKYPHVLWTHTADMLASKVMED